MTDATFARFVLAVTVARTANAATAVASAAVRPTDAEVKAVDQVDGVLAELFGRIAFGERPSARDWIGRGLVGVGLVRCCSPAEATARRSPIRPSENPEAHWLFENNDLSNFHAWTLPDPTGQRSARPPGP